MSVSHSERLDVVNGGLVVEDAHVLHVVKSFLIDGLALTALEAQAAPKAANIHGAVAVAEHHLRLDVRKARLVVLDPAQARKRR